MRRKGMIGTIFAVILVIALAVTLAAAWFVTSRYVVVNWQLFPKGQSVLDLRNQAISQEDFDELVWKLPGTEILWSVPFQNGFLSSNTEALTLTRLQDSDIPMLDYLPRLKTVDASRCTDYPALMALYTARPDLDVQFTLPIGGQEYDPGATSITLTTLTEQDRMLLELMPRLKTLDAAACKEYPLLNRLQQEHPNWEITTTSTIAGIPIDPSAVELELSGAGYPELSVGLAAMPQLTSLTLHDPQATGAELQQLCADYPGITIRWDVTFEGQTYPDDTAELDISHAPIRSVAAAKAMAAKFPRLTKLIMDSTGIPDEDMAIYREEMRSSYKVVWTVHLTSLCSARTDDTYFMPIKQGEYYFQEKHVYPLRYCEDMVCIDIGHSTVSTVDFAAYMPHLKYLVLAWTQVTDITPLASCKELLYLEIDNAIIHDYSPLVGCTALEDLNISCREWDVSCEPIAEMTWLKNLWMIRWNLQDYQKLCEALPDTHIAFATDGPSVGMGWRNLQNYYDMRDCLGMYYMS